MDNLTHSLVGLAAAKAGLERSSPYATAVCVIAANLPDADLVILPLAGRWSYLEHHRGLSHSVVGVLALAILLPLLFYAGDYIVAHLRRRPPRARLRGLIFASLVLSASHPLLDWTNNYGVRPLLPWDARWFYGDLVFILDPWLWLSIGGAAFLLTARTKRRALAWAALALLLTVAILFLPTRTATPYPLASRALWVGGIVGLFFAHRARIAERFGASIPAAALALVVVYWSGLAVLHARALTRAQVVAERVAAQKGESLTRIAAMPMLADPTRWLVVAETNNAFERFILALNERGDAATRDLKRFEKPQGEEAEAAARAAREDRRAAILLDFSRFPATRVERNCAAQTIVQFADLRFTEPGREARGTFSVEVPVEDK